MKYPPPTVGKFRTVRKTTVRKFRTLLLVNQGRVVWGWSWAGLMLSGWPGVAAEGKECNAADPTKRQGSLRKQYDKDEKGRAESRAAFTRTEGNYRGLYRRRRLGSLARGSNRGND